MSVEAVAGWTGAIPWIVVLLLALAFYGQIVALLGALVHRVMSGDEIKTPWITIGRSVGELRIPEPDEVVTDDHLALIHSSWRVPHRDVEFGGQPMYQIHVILFGRNEILDRVERVTGCE